MTFATSSLHKFKIICIPAAQPVVKIKAKIQTAYMLFLQNAFNFESVEVIMDSKLTPAFIGILSLSLCLSLFFDILVILQLLVKCLECLKLTAFCVTIFEVVQYSSQ